VLLDPSFDGCSGNNYMRAFATEHWNIFPKRYWVHTLMSNDSFGKAKMIKAHDFLLHL
jgi:hypothetical protein